MNAAGIFRPLLIHVFHIDRARSRDEIIRHEIRAKDSDIWTIQGQALANSQTVRPRKNEDILPGRDSASSSRNFQ